MKDTKPTVAVFGGGIAGMTVAHELAEQGIRVSLYEKDRTLGGMAKSIRDPYNDVPTEHSWRAYARFYDNLFDILHRIPIRSEPFNTITLEQVKQHTTQDSLWTTYKGRVYDITSFIPIHPGGSVILQAGGKDLEQVWKENGVQFHNNSDVVQQTLQKYQIGLLEGSESFALSQPTDFTLKQSVYDNLNQDDISFVVTTGSRVSPADVPYLVYSHLRAVLSNPNRPDQLYSSLKDKVSKGTWDYLAYFLGASGFGFDINTIGLRQYATFLTKTLLRSGWTTLNQPTSEGWIDLWSDYLQSLGVLIHPNSELTQIHTHHSRVASCTVVQNGSSTRVEADQYCFCLNPNLSTQILERSGMVSLSEQFRQLSVTNNQVGFVIAFRGRVCLPKKGFSLNNSPFNITLYPQCQFWEGGVFLGDGVGSLWSGTAVTPYRKGMSGKTGTEMTRPEMEEELFNQVFTNPYFGQYRNSVQFVRVYGEWQWDGSRLTSSNPKWVNTLQNNPSRPGQVTEYDNLFLGGAHTRTTVDIWCMEGAVESGKLVAKAVLSSLRTKPQLGGGIRVYDHRRVLFRLGRVVDGWLYRMGLPNVVDMLLLIGMLLIVIKKIK